MYKNIESFKQQIELLYNKSMSRLAEVKSHMLQFLPFWIAGSLTALVATFYARLFSICEELSLKIFEGSGLWFLLIAPLCFFVSGMLVDKLAPFANGSGIPQLMVSIDLTQEKKHGLVGRFLGLRIILIKILSSLVGVVGGGAIGREGPTLQIAGSIFHIVNNKWITGDIKNRSGFLLAGAASGLASAFNTPLGGIVYVIEELAKSHLSSFRTGVVHAVIFAGVISQSIMGPYLYLGYPKTGVFQYNMIIEFVLIALLSAIVVTLFTQSLKVVVVYREKLRFQSRKILFSICVGFVFAVLCIWVSKDTMGSGKHLLTELLFHDQSATFLDVISRFLGSMLTYSSGGAGGIFAPILSLGGSVGSFFGGVLGYDFGPLVVLIGMTSGLTALTHSPLTSFILILEMTDRHSAIFPLMIAAAVGHGVSKMISKKSFYEFVAERLFLGIEKETQNDHKKV